MWKGLKWFFMLSKRLYKKPSFVVLLLLIPICISAFGLAAKQSGGFVHIVLAQTGDGDEISNEIIESFVTETSLLRFTRVSSPQAAINEVENGLADEAWIFPADTEAAIKTFIDQREPVVSVYTKEQNVTVRLAREKLAGKLFKSCAKPYYLDYLRENVPQLEVMSDAQLLEYFENAGADDRLFVFEDVNGVSQNIEDANYLTTPVRGFLAILAMLCGMAATMYYKQDEKSGTFAHVPMRRRVWVELGCVSTAVLNVLVVLLLSMCVASLAGGVLMEIGILLLYGACCTAFCLLLGRIFSNVSVYGAFLPLLTVVCIGICPVFFDFGSLYALQMLLPPTYYVKALYNTEYLAYMAIYSGICFFLNFLLYFAKNRFRKKRV